MSLGLSEAVEGYIHIRTNARGTRLYPCCSELVAPPPLFTTAQEPATLGCALFGNVSLRGATMPITDAGRFLFARDPLGNPSPQAGQQQGTRRLDNEGGAGGQEIVHAEPSTSHQRPWKGAKPTGIKTMVETSFRCCLTLSCVERFARGDNDAQRLHLEQKNFARLPSASARLQWVREHVPFAKVGRREGSLYSAGSLVCNKFFRLAYGVSANTIENAKRNPKAPTKRGLR